MQKCCKIVIFNQRYNLCKIISTDVIFFCVFVEGRNKKLLLVYGHVCECELTVFLQNYFSVVFLQIWSKLTYLLRSV